MKRGILTAGTLFGLLAVVLGAFAAHGLKPRISPDSMMTFETGVRYQMYSAFFLLFVGIAGFVSEKIKRVCFYLTVPGILLFSGSIYLLATNSLTSFDFTAIALATPLGGTLLITGWVMLFISCIKLKKK